MFFCYCCKSCTHLFCLYTDNVCLRPWAFERIPNKMIRGLDNALIYTSTKEACLAACLNEVSYNSYYVLKLPRLDDQKKKLSYVMSYLKIKTKSSFFLKKKKIPFTLRSCPSRYVLPIFE